MGGVGVPVRAGDAPAASVWRRGGVGCNQLDRGKEKVKVPNLCAERTCFGGCVNTALFDMLPIAKTAKNILQKTFRTCILIFVMEFETIRPLPLAC